MKWNRTEILVIGGGISGMLFALLCSDKYRITLVCKGKLYDSNTGHAQGGIAAVLGAKDSFLEHMNDTLVAGDGLCREDMVRFLVKKAPEGIRLLQRIGVPFDINEDGSFDLATEGGHHSARVAHVKDETGKGIVKTLSQELRQNPNIKLLEDHYVTDLLIANETCYGARVVNKKQNEIFDIEARITMLAAGGAGQLYQWTTNPEGATGDGFALAYLSGAELANMEFVQFHPTMLYCPSAEALLISEALRGFGAKLIHADGKKFMDEYHSMGDLAPRDIVSRAIVHEMKLKGTDCVYLDLTFFEPEDVMNRFPGIYRECMARGIDITKVPIPVVPGAHYMCGGVISDKQGRTNIHNLLVSGENSFTGVHGANRLASNSLLEALVFARTASEYVLKLQFLPSSFPASYKRISEKLLLNDTNQIAGSLSQKLKKLMWEKAGIIRNKKELEEAMSLVKAWLGELNGLINKEGVSEQRLESRNLLLAAKLVLSGALLREESRGGHYRSDFPTKWEEGMETMFREEACYLRELRATADSEDFNHKVL